MNSKKIITMAFIVLAIMFAQVAPALAKTDTEALEGAIIKAGKEAAKSVVQIRVIRVKSEEVIYKEIPKQDASFRPTHAGQKAAPGYFARPYGACSGVLVDAKDGYVLTSNYNVQGKIEKIFVTFSDGERFEADLLGRSEMMDVAMLKIKGDVKRRAYMKLKQPKEKARIGKFVLVVSRTENLLMHSQTFGIISAVKRLNPRVAALQIDAKINYGNSGAPVIDIEGNMIGLVGFVRSDFNPVGQSSGIGFASTIEKILDMLSDLKAGKFIAAPKTPFLGVKFEMSYNKNDGILISEVIAGSAAQEAGLQSGDLIVAFEGKPVRTPRDLVVIIQQKKVGDKVTFKVKRNGKVLTLQATLKSRPAGQ